MPGRHSPCLIFFTVDPSPLKILLLCFWITSLAVSSFLGQLCPRLHQRLCLSIWLCSSVLSLFLHPIPECFIFAHHLTTAPCKWLCRRQWLRTQALESAWAQIPAPPYSHHLKCGFLPVKCSYRVVLSQDLPEN